jgi:hypothetical protein
MNVYYLSGPLDRKYLRVCAVYRLLRLRKIGKSKAIELLAARHSKAEMVALVATVEMWRAGPLKEMMP